MSIHCLSRELCLRKLLSAACGKINDCQYVTEACRKQLTYDPKTMRALPERRWIDCAGWKLTLGMVFDKESGSWIYSVQRKIGIETAL